MWDVSHRGGAGRQGGCSSLYRVAPLRDDHVPVFTALVQVQRSSGIEGYFAKNTRIVTEGQVLQGGCEGSQTPLFCPKPSLLKLQK